MNTTLTASAIEVTGLSKCFGDTRAVDDLSFSVSFGRVVGFLGPNGAGKTTTLRALAGLIAPTTGTATIEGRRYAELTDPMHAIGACLDGGALHPDRSARDHLLTLARAGGVPRSRVDELLTLVDLRAVGERRARGYSLGMRQRLGLAAALLGDPPVLVLDEPANGLDPQGIRWLRDFLRSLAGEGRAVLISSHVLVEVAQTVDDVVIVARGRSVAQTTLQALLSEHGAGVHVAGPGTHALAEQLRSGGADVRDERAQAIRVRDRTPDEIARAISAHGLVITELTPMRSSLEEIYLELTGTPNGGPS